jgi:F-type H+-transporting ATPase subunit a
MLEIAAFANPVEDVVLFRLGPIPVTRIIVVTWGVMLGLVLFGAFVRLRLRQRSPGKAQQVIEAMLNWLADEIRGIIGREPGPFIPLVASLFIFILASNFVAFISSFFEMLKPPTADINTTAALATVVFLAVPFYGIAMTGTLNYLKTYIRPVWIMAPFNIISDLSRTLAMAVRLFGNILSGEILFGVMVSLVPFFLPLPLMFLSLITGTIQAYIFAVLTIVYIGGAVKVVAKHEAEDKTQ